MIEVKNLTKRYRSTLAVNDISFTVEKGHIYGLLGANGAGKSTTINMLCGTLAPTSGNIKIGGYDLAEEPEKAKALIGYLPDNPPLYLDMTPREYLTFIASARKMNKELIFSHIETIMKKTKISEVSNKLIKNLSKGYRQRVGIAQAMIGDPEIIILDEPTVALDPRQIIEIRELICELGKSRTVILSSHILTEVAEICDRIIIIEKGSLIACDTLENLQSRFVGPDTLTLIAKTDTKQAVNILKKIPKLSKVTLDETSDGFCEISLECPKDHDIRESVFWAFSEAKCPLISINLKKASLEDLFLSATEEESAVYPDDETQKKTVNSQKLPSLADFFKSTTAKNTKDASNVTDDDDDDDSYKPLFARK